MNILEWLYYGGYLYSKRRGLRASGRLPAPVVSIGNITLGGTGKTPAAMAVAEEARRRGWRPVILTRGYRGTATGPCFVTRGDRRLLTAREAGDEPALMADRLRDVPIVKSPDRHAGGLFALQSLDRQPERPLLFVLDDGFQHWRLSRDADVVLIDGSRPFGNGRLLPLGTLREPTAALTRADFCIVTKGRNEPLMEELRRLSPGTSVHVADYVPRGIRFADGGTGGLSVLGGRNVFAFCGIAGPDGFRATLAGLGCSIAGFRSFGDHYAYREKDIAAIAARSAQLGCDLVVTTEKDLVKIRETAPDAAVCALVVDMEIEASFFEELFGKLSR